MNRLNYLYLLVLLMIINGNSYGQNTGKISIGDVITLHSNVLNEDREIFIYLPESYNESTFKYPVLYLLDAENEFHHTTGTINFLAGTGKIPEVIVAGIVNTNRSRDLTPEAPNDEESKAFWGEIGGAENFRNFIKQELIPFIDSNYRTANYKLLRGQSFGGLFGLYDLFKSERLFNAYILTSPSVSWNENIFFKKMDNMDFSNYVNTKVYIGEAEFDWGDKNVIREFSTVWSDNIPDKDQFKYEFFQNEGHYSLVFEATFHGLTNIYKNWIPPDSIINSSDFEKLKSYYSDLSSEFNYNIKVPMDQVIRFANNQLRKKNFDSGISISKQNIELYPDQPQTYWHAGDACSLAGDHKQALEYFELALVKAEALKIADLNDYKISIEETKMKLK